MPTVRFAVFALPKSVQKQGVHKSYSNLYLGTHATEAGALVLGIFSGCSCQGKLD